MLLAALTGGIGSGKSEVARRFAAVGAVIVDADLIARQVVEPGTEGLAQVVEAFGRDVLNPDGGLDREAVAARVFGDDEQRRKLNGILHPLIGAEAMRQIADAGERDPDAVVIQDIPLLAESNLAGNYEVRIVVDVPPDVQLDRLVRLRGMAESDARARIASQASREDRLALATDVIDNSGGLDELQAQVEALWGRLLDQRR